jgi:hypothetical protein
MIFNVLLFFFLFWQKRKKQRKLPFSQRQTRSVSRAATTLNRSLQYRIPFGMSLMPIGTYYDAKGIAEVKRLSSCLKL